MGRYPAQAEDVFADAEAKIEQARAVCEQLRPVQDTPGETYLVDHRGIPRDTVRACIDLYYLPPPLTGLGRPPQDHALVSVLRDAAWEWSGIQLEFVTIDGTATGAEPGKLTLALREHGVRDGLFHAGGGSGDVAYLTEGYSTDALSIAALGIGPAYGGGSRPVLGCALPHEAALTIIPDREPDSTVVDLRTGKSAADRHRADYKRAIDLAKIAGKIVRLAREPSCADGCKDVNDIWRKHDPAALRELLQEAEEQGLSPDGEARQLALIADALERDQQIKVRASALKVRVAVLRERVEHYRKPASGDTRQLAGGDVAPEEVAPWPHKVDGAELLSDMMAYINAHAIVPEHAALTMALWGIHTHAHAAAYHTPRLVFRSPTKGCGKSVARRVTGRLAARPFAAIDVTGPALFRSIEQHQVTVFIDEANEINWSNSRDLVSVINSGHCRDDPGVPRCVGDDNDVRYFRVWAPLCLALIGYLPTTIAERSIIIEMRRKARTTKIHRLVRQDRDQRAQELARKAARWAQDHMIELEHAEPAIPEELGDRPADNWRPLLAIADVVGCGDEAREAAKALIPTDDDGDDLALQLLRDIWEIFDKEKTSQLASSAIVSKLLTLEERPWPEMPRTHRPLTTNAMARLLRPFKIWPTGTIRIGSSTPKGYKREAFEKAWAEYAISGRAQPQPPHRHNRGAEPDSGDSQPPHTPDNVADGIGLNATESATCGGVAVATGSDSARDSALTLTCAVCGKSFEHASKGRTPTRCPTCRGAGRRPSTQRKRSGSVLERRPPLEDTTAASTAEAEAEQVITGMAAGVRCARCGAAFRPDEQPVEIAGKIYHDDDACAGEVRRNMAVQEAH